MASAMVVGTYLSLFLLSLTILTDFRPANILARISGLHGLSKQDIFQALGQPQTTKVTTRSGEPHNEPTAPQYLVYPINWYKVELSALGANFITAKACVIDFGESFDILEPPQDMGIPQVSLLALIVTL